MADITIEVDGTRTTYHGETFLLVSKGGDKGFEIRQIDNGPTTKTTIVTMLGAAYAMVCDDFGIKHRQATNAIKKTFKKLSE